MGLTHHPARQVEWFAEVQKLEGDRVTQCEDVEFHIICL